MKMFFKRLLCLLCALITLVSFCSCGGSGKISDKEITSLIDSYLELNLLTHNSSPATEDWDDYVEIDGRRYYDVIDERFDTWEQWENYILSIVCGELADWYLQDEGFINVDGMLYAYEGGMGYTYTDDYVYEILRNGDGEAVVRVTNPDVWGNYADEKVLTFTLTDDGWRIGRE